MKERLLYSAPQTIMYSAKALRISQILVPSTNPTISKHTVDVHFRKNKLAGFKLEHGDGYQCKHTKDYLRHLFRSKMWVFSPIQQGWGYLCVMDLSKRQGGRCLV